MARPPDVIILPDQSVDRSPAGDQPGPSSAPPERPRRKTKSGSEKRSRAGVMRFRLTHAEYAEIEALAEARGEDVGPYARGQALAEPSTAARATHVLKRPNSIPFRVSEPERAQIVALASRANLSTGSYLRARALNRPVTLSTRPLPVDRTELVRLLGLLGNVASNVNQIARQLNTDGDVPLVQVDDALDSVKAASAMLMRSLGREPK